MNSNKITDKRIVITRETAYYVLLSMLWTNDLAVRYFRAIMRRIVPIQNSDAMIISLIYILLILGALSCLGKKIKLRDIIFYILICIVYLMSYCLTDFARVKTYLGNSAIDILLTNIPCFFVGLAYSGKKELKILYKVSIISVVLEFLSLYVMGLDYYGYSSQSDMMQNAYGLLPHLLLIYAVALKRKSALSIGFAIFTFVLMLAYGTRGPVILALAYFFVAYVFVRKKKVVIWRYVLLGIIVLMVILEYMPILRFLEKIIDDLGMSTRVIDKFLNGSILMSNGRDDIQKAVMSVVRAHPFGSGMAADRFSYFSYSHNLLYEIWISYGVIWGSIFFSMILLILVVGYLKADRERRLMILLLAFSNGFFKLFMSSSYLLEHFFWMMLGVCIASLRSSGHKDDYYLLSRADVNRNL